MSKMQMKSRRMKRIDNNVSGAEKYGSYKMKRSSSTSTIRGHRSRRRSAKSPKRREKIWNNIFDQSSIPKIRTKDNKRERLRVSKSKRSLGKCNSKNSISDKNLSLSKRTKVRGNNRRRSKSTKATSKRPKRKGAFLSKSTSSLSTVYNSNYRSIYEQKTSVNRRKVRYGKRGKKSVKSPPRQRRQ